jgi:hypothetical protein
MKKVLGILLAVSVLGNLALLYGSINQAVRIDHTSSELERRESQIEAATKLFRPTVKGQSTAALVEAAKREKLEILQKDERHVYINGIEFTSDNGAISSFSFECCDDLDARTPSP